MFTFTINTRYNQPTESKGSSITAYVTSGCINRSMTIAYDYALSSYQNHKQAVNQLAAKYFQDIEDLTINGETRSKKGNKYIGYIYK